MVAGGDRDRVADRDIVLADQDLADDEPDDLLALLDGQALGVGREAGTEAFELLGELEVGLGVVQLGVQGVELSLQGGLAFAQLGRAGAKLLERDQLLLVAVQQPPERGLGTREVALERVPTPSGRVRRAHRFKPPVDLGLDQRRVLQQSENSGPDELVDLGQTDRPVVTDTPFGPAVAVGARAAVVLAQHPVRAAGRAAVVGIAAMAAYEDPLQQRRALGVARRDAPVALEPLPGELELLGGHERRHRDLLPLLRRDTLARDPGRALPAQSRQARPPDGRAGRVRLAVGGLPGIRRVAEHPPDRGVIPAGPAGPGRHALF